MLIRFFITTTSFLVIGLSTFAYAAKVVNLSIDNKTYTSMDISWERGVPEDNEFEVRMQANGGPWNPLGRSKVLSRTVTGLKTGSKYRFKVKAMTGGGWVTSDEIYTRLHAPKSPVGLSRDKLRQITSTSIPLAWDEPYRPDIVESYGLQYRAGQDTEWQRLPEITAGTNRYVIKQLQSETQYTFRVQARNSDGASEWSEISLSTGLKAPSVPKLGRVSHDEISVGWPTVLGEHYILAYRRQGEDKWIQLKVGADRNRSLPYLKADSYYEIRLRRQRLGNLSPWSDVLTARTHPLPVPAVISLPTVAAIGSETAMVIWSPRDANGNVEFFELAWKSVLSEQWSSVSGLTDANFEIKQLKPGADYEVRVRAINLGLEGQWSGIARFITSPEIPSKMVITEFRNISGDTIGLTWLPEKDAEQVEHYQIEYRKQGEKAWKTALKPGIKQFTNFLAIDGLESGTVYEFRVAGLNADKRGDWSATQSAETKTIINRLLLPGRR